MNKNILKKAILIATSLWACQSMAVGFTVPNTFESGTAASAAEVNANFEAIETAIGDNANSINTNVTDINTNTANITALSNGSSLPAVQLKDANGAYVGRVISLSGPAIPYVLTDQGYITTLMLSTGEISNKNSIYYENTVCTGTAYTSAQYSTFDGQLLVANGTTTGDVYYVALGTPVTVVNINSRYNGACDILSLPSYDVQLALPNDPNVTGIANTATNSNVLYNAPMKFE